MHAQQQVKAWAHLRFASASYSTALSRFVELMPLIGEFSLGLTRLSWLKAKREIRCSVVGIDVNDK